MSGTTYLLFVFLLTQVRRVLFFLKVKWRVFWLCLFVLDLVLFDPLSTSCLTCPIWGSHFSLSFLCAAHSNESWCRSKWSAPNDQSTLSQAADMTLQSGPNLTDLQINSPFSFFVSGWLYSFACSIWLYSFLFHPSVTPHSFPHSLCLWRGIYWSV